MNKNMAFKHPGGNKQKGRTLYTAWSVVSGVDSRIAGRLVRLSAEAMM